MDQFYNIEVRAAMMEDSKNSSKEISQSVLTSKDIGANIHLLMYRKGAAVLRMLHKYIGDEAFFEGLKLYVRRFAYRSAGQDDLWHAIRLVFIRLIAMGLKKGVGRERRLNREDGL